MENRRCMKCMHALAAGETVCPECGRPYGSVKAESFALKPGTILDGKYLVGEMLGQGGFGITYIGFDLLLEQKIAIKEYFPMSTGMVSREGRSTVVWSDAVMQKSGVEKGFDSFLKEARKMAKLRSIPSVVGVNSVFIQNETAYIVMDFIEGETLLKKLQREGPMDYGTCVSLMTPIMQALSEVHKHGIIHRDISPDNIMVQSDGKLILLDLGAAKDLDIQGKDGNVQSSQMVAKHGFSPVEQYGQAGKIGPWTDVYAMAATIYYCCTGVLPPSATDRMIEDTLTCRPRLTKEQFDVLAFCMNVLPQNRPQNMDALLQIVTHPAGKTPPVRDVPKTEPVRPETRNLQPLKPAPGRPLPKWLIPGIAAAVAVIALIISIGSGGKSPSTSPSIQEPIKPAAVQTEPTAAFTFIPPTPETTVPVESFPYLDGNYVGTASSGVPDGEGTLSWAEGTFTGTFRNGYPETGVFTFADDAGLAPVEGAWTYGETAVTYDAGSWRGSSAGQYTGMLLQGVPCGYGTLSYEYGGSYRGTFQSGFPAGKGTYTYHSGVKQSGSWLWEADHVDSLYPSREGSTTYYTGMICGGQPCGFGSLQLENCGTFYGEFADGIVDGYGIYVYRTPVPASQPTVEGDSWRMVSAQKKHDHTYYGLTLNGSWQGFGLGITAKSYHYVGEIRNEFRNGYGRLFTPNNSLYQEGTYVNGALS